MAGKKRQPPEQVAAISDALVPAAETPDWALEPTGAAGEFGLTLDTTHLKKQTWGRQELFLAAYRKCGKINKAAVEAGMTRWGAIRSHFIFSSISIPDFSDENDFAEHVNLWDAVNYISAS